MEGEKKEKAGEQREKEGRKMGLIYILLHICDTGCKLWRTLKKKEQIVRFPTK